MTCPYRVPMRVLMAFIVVGGYPALAAEPTVSGACPTQSLADVKTGMTSKVQASRTQLIDRQKFWAELDKLTATKEIFKFTARVRDRKTGKKTLVEKQVQLGRNIVSPGHKEVVEAIFQRWEATGGGHPKHLALILGTAYRETCGIMRSTVGEACGCSATCSKDALNSRYGTRDQCGRAYFGRGFVQITHRDNYARAGKKLDIPLAAYPNLAYEKDIAIMLLVDGAKNQWYAGKPLEYYLSDQKSLWVEARNAINPGSSNKAATGYFSCRFYGAIQPAYNVSAPAYPVDSCIKLKNL